MKLSLFDVVLFNWAKSLLQLQETNPVQAYAEQQFFLPSILMVTDLSP